MSREERDMGVLRYVAHMSGTQCRWPPLELIVKPLRNLGARIDSAGSGVTK
jgi:hypothetical protein